MCRFQVVCGTDVGSRSMDVSTPATGDIKSFLELDMSLSLSLIHNTIWIWRLQIKCKYLREAPIIIHVGSCWKGIIDMWSSKGKLSMTEVAPSGAFQQSKVGFSGSQLSIVVSLRAPKKPHWQVVESGITRRWVYRLITTLLCSWYQSAPMRLLGRGSAVVHNQKCILDIYGRKFYQKFTLKFNRDGKKNWKKCLFASFLIFQRVAVGPCSPRFTLGMARVAYKRPLR